MPDEHPRCVLCGKPVDPRGVDPERWCVCRCKWPEGGCGEPIYFLVNVRENRQPFNAQDNKPHHATCTAFERVKEAERTCPKCRGRRAKNGPCRHPGCGWTPEPAPVMLAPSAIVKLEDFL